MHPSIGRAGMRSVAIGLLSLCMLALAQAEVNLPLTCTQAGVAGQQTCTKSARVFAVPSGETLVSAGGQGWVPFAQAEGLTVLVCTQDIPAGSGTDTCPAEAKQQRDYCAVHGAECDAQDLEPSDAEPETPNSVTLKWTAPTQNTDGSALTNLAGFRIYSGTTKPDGSAPAALDLGLLKLIGDKTATQVTIPGFGWGRYYFAMTAHTTAGVESERTAVKFAEFVKPQLIPGQPTGVTIEITLTGETP